MKRALLLAGLAALVMAARPGTEFNLVTQLNGQPVRWVLPDGGRSGIFTQYDGGAANDKACMALTGAKQIINGSLQSISPNVLLVVPLQAVNLCIRPSVFDTSWDGGCNYIPTDENYGVPLAANVPQYITPDSRATSVCAIGDAGSLSVPIWTVQ